MGLSCFRTCQAGLAQPARVCEQKSDNAFRWDSFRQASFIHDAQFPIDLPPVADWHGPFLCRFKGRQVEGLEQCVITGEDAALPVQFPVCGV